MFETGWIFCFCLVSWSEKLETFLIYSNNPENILQAASEISSLDRYSAQEIIIRHAS